jgi:hypothetical protein
LLRAHQAVGITPIGDDGHNLRGQTDVLAGVEQGLQIGAIA